MRRHSGESRNPVLEHGHAPYVLSSYDIFLFHLFTFVNTRRLSMQQRYCECGHPVMVAYVITQKGVRHLYQPRAKMIKLMRCPSCGRPIDINNLK
jgi:hypothetical protein